MNRNRIRVSQSESVNLQSNQTSNTRWETLCECFRRSKLMRIIRFSIVAILIILGVCIPTIIILTEEENTPSTISTTTTSITTTKSTTTTISTTVILTTTTTTISTTTVLFHNNMKWKRNGSTVAGGNEPGNQLNQLFAPRGIYLDDDDNQTLYIADFSNHRIVKWKSGAKNGKVLAGGDRPGNEMDQLFRPIDLVIDKKTDSLIICDFGNRRILRQSLRGPTDREIIIRNISCWGLAMNNDGDLYVADFSKSEVRRWTLRDMNETLVAGGNGRGTELNQLSYPTCIFVDEDHSVYASDLANRRVTKWMKGAKEGIIVAGGCGSGNGLTQLNSPMGVFVDRFGNVYVADSENHRVVRWLKDATEGSFLIVNYWWQQQSNPILNPNDLSFDRQGNLYVAEGANNRVQKFAIDVD